MQQLVLMLEMYNHIQTSVHTRIEQLTTSTFRPTLKFKAVKQFRSLEFRIFVESENHLKKLTLPLEFAQKP